MQSRLGLIPIFRVGICDTRSFVLVFSFCFVCICIYIVFNIQIVLSHFWKELSSVTLHSQTIGRCKSIWTGGKTLQEKIENVYCVILVILETSFITYFHVQNSTTIAIYLFAKNVEIEQTH